MIRVTDATGEAVDLPSSPRRLVSLVPSTTESVHALGAGDHLVGVTRFCVHPPEARQRARVVGGTKSPRLELVRQLEPELILANQEENRESDVVALRHTAPVYVAFPCDVASAFDEMQKLAQLLDREQKGREVLSELERQRALLADERTQRSPFRFLYLIWQNPYMAVGHGTFIHGLLSEAGGENAVSEEADRYPALTPLDIARLRPDTILLSSEPFPFKLEHADQLLKAIDDPAYADEGRIQLVDGELLSWHGVRMRQGLPYLRELARRISRVVRS